MARTTLFLIGSIVWITFLFGGPAAATSVSLVWTGLNGAPIAETTTLTAFVGDTAQLELRVSADAAGVGGVSQSFAYDTTILDAELLEVCPAGIGNLSAGFCGLPAFGQLLTPVTGPSAGIIDDPAGEVTSIAALAVPATGQANHTFTLGRVDFTLTSAGFSLIDPFFVPGVDGASTPGGTFFFPDVTGAEVTAVVPEPGTALLLGSGILALAALRPRV